MLLLLPGQVLMAQKENEVAKALRNFNNDTAAYLQQLILSHKNQYIGKPLDSLLKYLPFVIEYTNADAPRNRSICPATSLYFSSYKQRTAKIARKEFPLLLVITWATPLDNKELPSLGLKLWGDTWTPAAYNYYKDKIVGNIETIKYNTP